MADGERETVTVEADNIQDARAKARAGAETGSTVGLPVLQAAPTRAARPIVQPGGGMGDTGFIRLPLPGDPQTAPMPVLESDFLGDTGFVRLPGIGAPPRTTFRDFTQTIDPDLLDPGSSTFVPPVVPPTAVEPAVPFRQGPTGTLAPSQGGSGFQIVTPRRIHGVDEGAPSAPHPGWRSEVVPPPAFVPPGAAWPGRPPGKYRMGEYGDFGASMGEYDIPGMTGETKPFEYQEPLPPANGSAGNGAGNGVVNGGAVNGGAVNGGAVNGGAVNGGAVNGGAVNGGAGGNGEVVVQDPATGIPILTSREMIDDQVLRRAGMRRALQNVFGQELGSGVGPLAGYLERQAYPLSDAMTAGAYADMARAFARDRDLATLGGTAAGPQQFDYGVTSPSPTVDQLAQQFVDGTTADFGTQRMEAMLADPEDTSAAAAASGTVAGGLPAGYSFENFLRTTRDQPTGLGGAYGQALQDVSYLRGLGSDALPPVLQAAFNPGSAEATADVANLLGAAQRGRYSGLVSSRFRQPTQQDLFADYFLSRQDAAKAGQTPQNFLNFAASRFGL